MTNGERIELCLQRLSMGKTSDVMNFSYADTLEYIASLYIDWIKWIERDRDEEKSDKK